MRIWALGLVVPAVFMTLCTVKDDAPTDEGIGDLEVEVDHLVETVRDRFPEAYAEALHELDTGGREAMPPAPAIDTDTR